MSNRDDFGTFVIGLVVGGITGAMLALLFAPQSGEETRTVIKEKAIELKDKTSETVGEAYAKAEAAANDAVKHAEALLQEAKARAASLSKSSEERRVGKECRSR